MSKIRFWFLKPKNNEVLVLTLFVIISGFVLFWIGLHAIDLCRNELAIEHQINNYNQKNSIPHKWSISEATLMGKEIDLNSCHSNGMSQMVISTFIILIGSLYFGIKLGEKK